jgi:Immunity protein 26
VVRNPFEEGDVFAVPLASGMTARGVVARKTLGARTLGYFFGPSPTASREMSMLDLSPGEALYIAIFGALALRRQDWPVLGHLEGWSRESWPVPVFGVVPLLEAGRPMRRYYDEKLAFVREEFCSLDEALSLPADGTAGSGYVSQRLSKVLAGER